MDKLCVDVNWATKQHYNMYEILKNQYCQTSNTSHAKSEN